MLPFFGFNQVISIRTSVTLLLVTAFYHFATCPTVHMFGEDIKHDLLPKIEADELQKETAKEVGLSFFKLSPTSHSNPFHHTRNTEEYSIY